MLFKCPSRCPEVYLQMSSRAYRKESPTRYSEDISDGRSIVSIDLRNCQRIQCMEFELTENRALDSPIKINGPFVSH